MSPVRPQSPKAEAMTIANELRMTEDREAESGNVRENKKGKKEESEISSRTEGR